MQTLSLPKRRSTRISQEVDPDELREYLARKNALSVEIMPGVHLMDLSAPAPGPDPRIRFDRRLNTCTLFYQYPYEIDLDRIPSPAHLLSWALHLCEKTWMDTARLSEFVERVGDYKGWTIRLDD